MNSIKNLLLAATFSLAIFKGNTATSQQNNDRVHLGFIYPLSTHGTDAPKDTNNLSFHVLAGVSAEERGVAYAGLTNVVKHNLTGVSFAGFSNHIGKKVKGVLFAGFANTYKEAEGLQFAGFSNIAKERIEGSQFAGFLNKSGDIKGAQFAGFSNIAKRVKGAQFGGFSNVAAEVKGSQFAGFGNSSRSGINGTQMAGFINVAGDVEGSQFAGFINIARKVKGAQVAGFINIAESSDHPIGIVNIIKNGEKGIGVSMDETQTSMLSFRSGGKVLYGIIGAGYNFKNEEEVYAFEAGLGAHFFNTGVFRLNTEITTQTLEDFKQGEYFKSSLRIMPAIKLGGFVEVFGGPALQFVNTNTDEGKGLVSKYVWERQGRWNNNFRGLYIGYTAGINLTF